MMMIVWPALDVTLLSAQAVFGFGVASGLLLALAISAKRWLIGYLVAGLLYWFAMDGLQQWLTQRFLVSDWHGFVMAFAVSWLPLCLWAGYRVLRNDVLAAQSPKPRISEHSPVYDDDFQPRFR